MRGYDIYCCIRSVVSRVSMIYFTSDLHFCHDKDFILGPRGFTSSDEMNAAIIRNWNSIVAPGDEVYVLGDLMLRDNEEGLRCWDQLRGTKHVILGNHDSDQRIGLYKKCSNTIIEGYAMKLKINGYTFFLSHYPTLIYEPEEKPLRNSVINLCGHVHTKDRFLDMDKGLIYHVELEAHDNMPVSVDEILEDIRKVR